MQVKNFDSTEDQYTWVAEEISKNITEGELDADDILVIFAASNTMGVPAEYQNLKNFLDVKGIKSILADKDTFRETGKVTCSQIYRAKGNESPMVYVVNSENCAGKSIGIRNIIFTAITRSRAWVRILGVGESMKKLAEEINSCVEDDYALKFKYPTPEELEKIRAISFDSKKKTDKKKQRAKFIKLFKEGKISNDELERALDNLE